MNRDPKFVAANLEFKDGKVYCKKKTTIEFPKWYEEKELASLQEISYVYGIFAIIIDDKYSVSIIPTLCATVPIMVSEVERNGEVYLQFVYGPGDCILDNDKVVKHSLLSYNFFEQFYTRARIPWYVEYEDMVRIMDNLPRYAGSNVGGNLIANELTTSFITRNAKNKKQFFRQVQKGDYEYVDLMNPYFASLSTTTSIGGNYFTQSLTSVIVQKNPNTTKLESHVRQ